MNIFYGGMPGKDFLISKYFDSRAELQDAGSSKHADLVTGDYVLIYATNAKHIDYNNGELWQRISTPADPKYKANYKEVITVTDAFGYGLIGNLAGPQGYTPEVGDNEHWWIGDVDTEKPARGAGIREIVVANASYTASQWSTYGTHGKSNAWTATNDISKLEVGDIAFFTGKVTDEVDAQNNPIQAALFFVITAISGTSVTGTSAFILKGSQGGIERIDTKTPTNIEGIVEGKGGVLQAATSIPTSLIDKNTADKDGLVVKGSGHPNSLWSTDASGNPEWRDLNYQNANQVLATVKEEISKSGHASFEKIDHIPTVEEAKDNILYLVYNTQTAHYDIYAKVVNEQGTPEVLLIDDTTVDLSDYVTNEALAAKDYATNSALQVATTEINTNLNNKVDKESGKGLSSNDYTAAEKTKLEGIEANADVNKIESVKLNGEPLPIDGQKAVNIDLSGYATDNELSSGLSSKVDKQEGKQLSTEDFTTAYKNKLDGIPEGGGGGEVNIINTVKVNGTPLVPDAQKAVDVKAYNEDNKPEVGGRNLLLNSGVPVTNYLYPINKYTISDKTLKNGEIVTATIKGTLGNGKTSFALYNSSGNHPADLILTDKGNGYYQATGPWGHSEFGNTMIVVYTIPETIDVESTIEWVKLERGEIATDWTPAPEDLEITPYISTPLPPSTTGSPGIAEEYARGDHVHPMQEGIAKINSIPGSSDLNDFKNVGLYVCFTSDSAQTILNTPTQYAFTLMVIHSTINDTAVIQLVWPYTDLHIYYRGYNGKDWGDWHTISNISDITASNFTGILPVEKGGTGNTYGYSYRLFDDAYVNGGNTGLSTVGSIIRNTADGNNLVAATGVYANKYSVRAFLGVGEDHFALDNNIAIQQNAADKSIIGTYKGREIATLTDYATSSKAGLVKPGAGLQVSDDGTLSLDKNYGASYGIIWGIQIDDTQDPPTLKVRATHNETAKNMSVPLNHFNLFIMQTASDLNFSTINLSGLSVDGLDIISASFTADNYPIMLNDYKALCKAVNNYYQNASEIFNTPITLPASGIIKNLNSVSYP